MTEIVFEADAFLLEDPPALAPGTPTAILLDDVALLAPSSGGEVSFVFVG